MRRGYDPAFELFIGVLAIVVATIIAILAKKEPYATIIEVLSLAVLALVVGCACGALLGEWRNRKQYKKE